MLRWLLFIALTGACSPDPGPPPDPWAPGELMLEQLDLRGWIGASTLIVGPDGTSVLIDVGNDRHAPDVIAAVEHHLGEARVDHAILTHFHADHVGGFAEAEEQGLEFGSVVTRGDVDLGSANESQRDQIVGTLAWEHRVDLCEGDTCDLPHRIELGEGAWLQIFAAAGQIAAPDGALAFDGEIPDRDAGENARSVAGIVGWGDFRYLFAGDLTGGGQDTPDLESFYAENLAEGLLPARGADIVQLSHHGIDSSTNGAWVDRVLPDDGSVRNAMVGSNSGYLDAPAGEVLDRLRGRLAGVWMNRGGLMTGSDDLLHGGQGAITVRVDEDGAAYTLSEGGSEERFATIR